MPEETVVESHIELIDVSVNFFSKGGETQAVKDVSLKIEKGDIFGIVGLSGAGKSTLVRTLNLLQPPTSGDIIIDDRELMLFTDDELRTQRQRMGMIFQHFNLIGNKTIFQNLRFALKAANYPKEKQKERISELLQLVRLADKADSYPAGLSGGQKQRVGIARAIANNPDILLCDEATSALDVDTTDEIVQLLKKINQELGITIVFITHEMEVAKSLFRHIAVMDKGEVVEKGPVYDIFSNPQSEMAQKLVNRTLALDVPEEILDDLKDGELVNIHYTGDSALNPIISTISKELDVAVNIIHGKIDYIDGKPLGTLLIHLTGPTTEVEEGIKRLEHEVFKLDRIHSKDKLAEVTKHVK